MADALLLPLSATLGDVDADALTRNSDAPRRVVAAAPRPRANRVGMLHAGYRAAIDGQRVALVNLSLTGAQIRSLTRVLPEQPAIIKIGWPQDEQSCAALARVRWVELDDERSGEQVIYRVGLAFETWDVKKLKDIVRHCERMFGRKPEMIDP